MTASDLDRRTSKYMDLETPAFDVVALSGSLRRGSLNTELLRRAQELAPPGLRVQVFAALGDIPHFNEDLEFPAPAAAQQLRERVLTCDGLLIATPEYNASIPGVLKNAIDWLSRPGTDGTQPLWGKPTAIMGASKGPFGSIRSQAALRQVLQKTGACVVAQPEVAVPFGDQKLHAEPQPDGVVAALLTQLLSELSVLIERSTLSAS
jgi:chromate reductase, NAD(P)H dehydrogenase (quinone)